MTRVFGFLLGRPCKASASSLEEVDEARRHNVMDTARFNADLDQLEVEIHTLISKHRRQRTAIVTKGKT